MAQDGLSLRNDLRYTDRGLGCQFGQQSPSRWSAAMKPSVSFRTIFLAAIALALLAGVATRPGAAQTPRIDLDVKRAVVRIVPERCFSASTCRAQLDQPGSGVVIHPSGLILTAWHVTSRDNDFEQENHWDDFVIEVIGEDDGLPPMAAYRARIVATRPEMDLALLRIDRDAEGEPLTPNTLTSLVWLPVYTDSSSRLEAGLTGLPVLGFPTPRLGGRASLFTNQRFTLDSQNRSDAELWVQWPLDRGYSGGPGLVWMHERWQVAGIVLSQLGSGVGNRTMLRDLSLAFRGFSWRPGEQEISATDIRLTRAVDDGQPYLKVDATIHSQGWEGTPLEFQLLFFQSDSRQPWRPARIDLPTLPSGQVYWSENLRPERPVEDRPLSFRVPLVAGAPPPEELVFQMKLAESDGGTQRWSSNRWHEVEAGGTSIDPTATPTPTLTPTPTPPPKTPDTLAAIEAGVRATLTASAPTATRAAPTATRTPTPTVTPTLDPEEQIAAAVAATLTALAPTPTNTPTPAATQTPNATATFQAAVNTTLTALAPSRQTTSATLITTPITTPTRTPTSKATLTEPTCIVLVQNLNLRSGPGTNYAPPIGSLPINSVLRVLGRNSNSTWVQIETIPIGKTGWVSAGSRYIDCQVTISTFPIVTIPPTSTVVISDSPTVPPVSISTATITASTRSVTLLNPSDSSVVGGRVQFTWNANFALTSGQSFEVIFWRPGQDPFTSGFGFGVTTDTTFIANLDAIDDDSRHPLAEGSYKWGILLVNANPYSRIQYLGGNRNIAFRRVSGSTQAEPQPANTPAPQPTNTPAPAPTNTPAPAPTNTPAPTPPAPTPTPPP